ncbi:hypothetical protein BGZ60DRAFT_212843 [Tricladium varicosporioides]|nr:hypothetical protein BGZ60DRAFT_212843 [Hymenoscyphus varicosporioides]
MGKMAVSVSSPLRTPWLATAIAIILIWSLYTLDIPSVRSTTLSIQETLQTHSHSGDGSTTVAIGAPTTEEIISVSTPATEAPAPVHENEPATSEEETENQGDSLIISERPLILYAYADGNTKEKTDSARKNLEFFIRHGLHAAADFIFIMNGETTATELIPKESHIRIVQRENDCYDMGAYAEVLTTDSLYQRYKHFIMLNASIRGPFLPYWARGCWSDMYLGRITDEVKLVGMTANCWPAFHIQSMIWATDIIGIETLLFPNEPTLAAFAANPPKPITTSPDLADLELAPQAPGINQCFHTWGEAVTAEVSASALIKAAGYKLDLMMSAYHGIEHYEEQCDSSENGDVLWDGEYFGTNVHPFETVFIKANRDVDPVGIEKHSEWMDGRGYSSYDFCKKLESPWVGGGSM